MTKYAFLYEIVLGVGSIEKEGENSRSLCVPGMFCCLMVNKDGYVLVRYGFYKITYISGLLTIIWLNFMNFK